MMHVAVTRSVARSSEHSEAVRQAARYWGLSIVPTHGPRITCTVVGPEAMDPPTRVAQCHTERRLVQCTPAYADDPRVWAHEIGHALGLDHDHADRFPIMAPDLHDPRFPTTLALPTTEDHRP